MTRAFGGVTVAVVLAALFALAGAAVLRTAEVLPGDVRLALRQGLNGGAAVVDGRTASGMDLTFVDGPPTGAGRGIQIVLFGVLLGGVPMALMALGLAWYSRTYQRHWSGGWSQVFLGGFIFQLSSLCVTSLLLIGMLLVIVDLGSITPREVAFGGALLISVGCSVVAVSSWRALRLSSADQPISVIR